MKISLKILLFPLAWLRSQFPRPAIRIPPWIRTLKISDDLTQTACIIGGFVMAFHGLKMACPWLAWFAGGIFLMWFGWPSRKGA